MLDLIKTKFPWYLHMHMLLGSSPLVNRSAVANSQTKVDVTDLDDCKSGKACNHLFIFQRMGC